MQRTKRAPRTHCGQLGQIGWMRVCASESTKCIPARLKLSFSNATHFLASKQIGISTRVPHFDSMMKELT